MVMNPMTDQMCMELPRNYLYTESLQFTWKHAGGCNDLNRLNTVLDRVSPRALFGAHNVSPI